ncbi:DNA primase [Caulobacter mirabilis]|uniref:DNA primase n=1 Tax=Caulobacter mirabilis TaxID=69666 RepID=A0A2D2AUE1_9CAUL|nr:DNA primase [Caulobacter mirabilis]ATQ41583.1 DNA primase [Caulobacter mirabilis]
MRFDDRFLEEIKSRVRLSDVIGKTVKLKRQGREYVGLSPFTKERSPSFFVNDDKGFYHDFSSGKHGDLISFLQETERLTFMEAVERLAAEAGMALPAPDPQFAEQEKKRQGLGDWMELAASWFEGELHRPVGKAARDYLTRRGLPEQEWKRFRIGFAPNNRTALKDYLITKGAKAGDLVEAGLLISPEDGGAPYDRFRDRIIFPIADARGRTVSFGGRAMDPEARAKYLNGPETSLFHKGRLLYGLPEARKLLHASNDEQLVVVEGYMDAIACQRANIPAVAPLGTALTEDQMEVLWRLHPEPTLCFDGDGAGMRAAARSIDRALPLLKPGKSFKFAIVVGGKDPDDVLREQGPNALKAQLAETTPFVDALFTRERDAEPLDTPERKAGLKQRLRAAAGSIADKDLAQAYKDDLYGRLDVLFARPGRGGGGEDGGAPRQARRPFQPGAGKGQRGAMTFDAFPTPEGKEAAKKLAVSLDPLAAALAKGALDDPHRLDDHLELLERSGFGDPGLSELAKEIIRLRLDADHLDSGALARHLRDRGFAGLLTDIDRAAARAGAPFLKQDVTLAAARSQWTHAFEVLNRLAALETALSSAKANLGGRSDMAAFERLKAERDTLKRAVRSGDIWTDGEA